MRSRTTALPDRTTSTRSRTPALRDPRDLDEILRAVDEWPDDLAAILHASGTQSHDRDDVFHVVDD